MSDEERPTLSALNRVANSLLNALWYPSARNIKQPSTTTYSARDVSNEEFKAVVKELRDRKIVTQMASHEILAERKIQSIHQEKLKIEDNDEEQHDPHDVFKDKDRDFLEIAQKKVALASKEALIRRDSAEQMNALRRVSLFTWSNMSAKWQNNGEINIDSDEHKHNDPLHSSVLSSCGSDFFLLRFDGDEEGSDTNSDYSKSLIVSFGNNTDLDSSIKHKHNPSILASFSIENKLDEEEESVERVVNVFQIEEKEDESQIDIN